MFRFANSLYFFDLPNDTHCSILHLFGIIEIYKSLIASRFLLLIIQRVLGQSECSTIRVSFQFSFSELGRKFLHWNSCKISNWISVFLHFHWNVSLISPFLTYRRVLQENQWGEFQAQCSVRFMKFVVFEWFICTERGLASFLTWTSNACGDSGIYISTYFFLCSLTSKSWVPPYLSLLF